MSKILYNGIIFETDTLISFDKRNYKNEDIVIPEGVKKIERYAFDMSCIKSVVIPKSVIEIVGRAFGECMFLEKVTLNEGPKRMGNLAFYRAKFSELCFPETVKEIEVGTYGRHNIKFI